MPSVAFRCGRGPLHGSSFVPVRRLPSTRRYGIGRSRSALALAGFMPGWEICREASRKGQEALRQGRKKPCAERCRIVGSQLEECTLFVFAGATASEVRQAAKGNEGCLVGVGDLRD